MTKKKNMIGSGASQEDFRVCREYTKQYAKTFYFASHVLPAEKKMAAYALYAFCRRADQIADQEGAEMDRRSTHHRLEALRDQVMRIRSRELIKDPAIRAFKAVVLKYGIPEEYFLDLLRGIEMDLTTSSYGTFKELEDYCYCVASTVGLMMTRVFGTSDDDRALGHAVDMGTAMQLTNILRDVGEDYRRGRVYLPQDELQEYGVSNEQLGKGRISPGFVRLMKFQIQRARMYYDRASSGIPMLTNDGSRFCVKLMSRTYERILHAVEKNHYDTLTRRAYVPLLQKIHIGFASYPTKEVSSHRSVH